MKMIFRHIPAFLTLVMLLFPSCLKEEDKVIPKGKLAKIYAEMLLTDQWIQDTPGIRSVADTSLIYEPILEKYGYDKMDYLHTVDRYLDDPERFSRIWRETSDILDARLKEAKKRRAALDDVEARIREREKYAVDFDLAGIFPCMFEEPFIHYHDSLAVQIDSSIRAYRLVTVVLADTTYEGVVMNVRVDSLALADSLALVDSLDIKPVSEHEKPSVKAEEPVRTIKELKKDRNLPLRQVKRPSYSKDLKTNDEFMVVEEAK